MPENGQPAADPEYEPLNDIPRRRATHGTDEWGRHRVNNHEDVDVVRTPQSNYPVQLPLEEGDVLVLDGEEMEFIGFEGDALKFIDPNDPNQGLDDYGYGVSQSWGVHPFNTAVRNAKSIELNTTRETKPKNFTQAPSTRRDEIDDDDIDGDTEAE